MAAEWRWRRESEVVKMAAVPGEVGEGDVGVADNTEGGSESDGEGEGEQPCPCRYGVAYLPRSGNTVCTKEMPSVPMSD